MDYGRKTAKVGTLEPSKTNSQGRTREPLVIQSKGGGFRKSERKSSGRKGRKRKRRTVQFRRSWWKKCKERIVRLFTGRIKEEKKEKEGTKRKHTLRAGEVSTSEVLKDVNHIELG